jgi:hypothetical protein
MQNALKTGIKTKKLLYIFIITHRGRKGKELSLKILSHIFTTCRFSSNKKEFSLKKFLFPC